MPISILLTCLLLLPLLLYVCACLTDSFFFSFAFLQLAAAMKLLQRKREDIRLQQWSLPSGVSQGCCLLPGLPHQELLFLLTWMLSFENSTVHHSVPIMLSTFGPLMIWRLSLKSSECRKGEFGSWKPYGKSMAAAHHTSDLVYMWEAPC